MIDIIQLNEKVYKRDSKDNVDEENVLFRYIIDFPAPLNNNNRKVPI